ncbi:MAG: TrmB family transcriptional regulator [Promethearchaeota archaeon]
MAFDIHSILGLLGLKGNKAEVYKVVLRYPGLNANQIQKYSQVPKNKIYQILDDLITRKIIFYANTRPKIYWPEDLKKIISIKQESIERELEDIIELRANVGEILQNFINSNQYTANHGLNKENIAIIKSDVGDVSQIFKILLEFIDNARHSVFFMGDFEDFVDGIQFGITQKVNELIERGVEIKQIMWLVPSFFRKENIENLRFLYTRERLEGRKTYFYINPYKFNIGIVIIDKEIIGIMLRNPAFNKISFSVYIHSKKLINDFYRYLGKIKNTIVKSLIESPYIKKSIIKLLTGKE